MGVVQKKIPLDIRNFFYYVFDEGGEGKKVDYPYSVARSQPGYTIYQMYK